MLADPTTARRCVATAQEHLSLRDIGIPRYDALYRAVARERVESSKPPVEPVDVLDQRVERERPGHLLAVPGRARSPWRRRARGTPHSPSRAHRLVRQRSR